MVVTRRKAHLDAHVMAACATRSRAGDVQVSNGWSERLPMPVIREVRTGGDVEQARRLFVEYQAALGIDLCFQGFAEELATLPGNYSRPGGRLLLAAHGATVLGGIALRQLGASDCEMKRLYVRPEGRGRGIGRMLATAVVGEAREAGYH